MSIAPQQVHYPSPAAVDDWARALVARAAATRWRAEPVTTPGPSHGYGVRHTRNFRYVRFCLDDGHEFHGYWQPALGAPAPLLVHLPGYGHEMSVHPELVAGGYNVLHVSPLGFASPDGPDEERMIEGVWPVLPDTMTSGGRAGYVDWLRDCLVAVAWGREQLEVLGERVSFFGTSQGGGAALLLGSVLRDAGVRCVAADEPYLTGFVHAAGRGGYAMVSAYAAQADDPASAWRALGFVDTLSHARRLTMPVLLTAGGADTTCPPDTIEALHAALPGTRSLTHLEGVAHGYTPEFLQLAQAWFRLYA